MQQKHLKIRITLHIKSIEIEDIFLLNKTIKAMMTILENRVGL